MTKVHERFDKHIDKTPRELICVFEGVGKFTFENITNECSAHYLHLLYVGACEEWAAADLQLDLEDYNEPDATFTEDELRVRSHKARKHAIAFGKMLIEQLTHNVDGFEKED